MWLLKFIFNNNSLRKEPEVLPSTETRKIQLAPNLFLSILYTFFPFFHRSSTEGILSGIQSSSLETSRRTTALSSMASERWALQSHMFWARTLQPKQIRKLSIIFEWLMLWKALRPSERGTHLAFFRVRSPHMQPKDEYTSEIKILNLWKNYSFNTKTIRKFLVPAWYGSQQI